MRAPLVGREHELNLLQAAFDRVSSERRPALVTLLGDAGIGKSRLVREFLSQLAVDAKVLVGRCLPSGQGEALLPLADMLNAEAVVFDSDSRAAAVAKVRQLVDSSVDGDLADDASRVAAALASTLNLQEEDTLAALDPSERRREIVGAWRAFFASLARRAPVVAVVEDLHWADPTMLDTLDDLAERLEGPVLFVCTARSDLLAVRPEWGGGRRSFSALPLDPLSEDESTQLVSHLLDADSLPGSMSEAILDRTEGNPFFLEEIVRHLIDENALVFDDGRWRARDRIATLELPDSVQAVILARLDLLAPDEKRVAQRAAVIGRFFWDGAVEAITGAEDLDAVLGTLRRREFVQERVASSIARQREFVFKHVLIRDVAYESLPRRERGRAHAEAAAWLERASGERAGEIVDQLAHHYEAAYRYLGGDDLRRQARDRLLAAAEAAHRRFALEHGEALARRAVELSEPGKERLEALEAVGDLHYHRGDAAWQAYMEALAETSADDPAFPRLAGKAAQFGARWVGTVTEPVPVEEVRNLIDAGLAAAAPASRDRVLLLVSKGFLLVQREYGDSEADAVVGEAVSSAEALDDADALSAARDLAEARELYRGRYGEMHRDALKRLELVPRIRDVKEIGDTYAMVAWSAQHLGRYREAEEAATTGIERTRDADAGAYMHSLTWRVATRFTRGDWDGALADQAELERVAGLDPRELPAGFSMRAYAYTALLHELRGDDENARRYIELTERALAQNADTRRRASFQAPGVARALARRGRFDDALEIVPLEQRSGTAGVVLEALCEIALLREDWDAAPALVRATREESEAGELIALPFSADRLEGQAAAAAGDATEAATLLRRSADGFRRLGAPWDEAWSRLLLAEVLAPSDHVSAQRELDAALAVFERLRSVREVERAHTTLSALS